MISITNMEAVHMITPVKDSIESTMRTIQAIAGSNCDFPHSYTVYNDFSTPENTSQLEEAAQQYGFKLVNLADVTSHPSPNYLLVLQMAQRQAIESHAGLLIVESDVTVAPDSLQRLIGGAMARPKCGIAAAVTTDEAGNINYPYLHAKGHENQILNTKKHCSFCCSLLTLDFLRQFDFATLDPAKNWFDVTISHESLSRGFHNYLFTTIPVVHHPHSSRPWKKLKYRHPLLYYWRKFTKGLDKI